MGELYLRTRIKRLIKDFLEDRMSEEEFKKSILNLVPLAQSLDYKEAQESLGLLIKCLNSEDIKKCLERILKLL